ncbi:YpmA family protein [Desulfallas sp. Bu1-1]|uniref:YpmA family protein n=1 Tax=Desulfallas sp. Bu1-1 TaxID=2787620 RepID=UPI0018A09E13|nr:YpmA family protein [Desulfallas sp. Bu1-1]MBF7083323.1 YpmA family protein [Desulfallas sp. Bu1-1]
MNHDNFPQGKLELIAHKSFPAYEDMYKVVDFLNKNLKDKKIMFGLTKNDKENTMTISIYEF